MSEALKIPNAKQKVEEAYRKMMVAYDRYFHCSEEQEKDFKLAYQVALDNYRDVCTVIIGRLLNENPKVLEDMIILYV